VIIPFLTRRMRSREITVSVWWDGRCSGSSKTGIRREAISPYRTRHENPQNHPARQPYRCIGSNCNNEGDQANFEVVRVKSEMLYNITVRGGQNTLHVKCLNIKSPYGDGSAKRAPEGTLDAELHCGALPAIPFMNG
jgi:hypothetical protein